MYLFSYYISNPYTSIRHSNRYTTIFQMKFFNMQWWIFKKFFYVLAETETIFVNNQHYNFEDFDER